MSLPSIRTVYSYFINSSRVISKILHMTQNVSAAVLGDEVSEVCAKTHVSYCRLMIAPFLHWEPFEKDEALAIENLGSDRCQQL